MSLSLEEKSELESILGSNLSALPNPQNIQDVYQLFTNTMTRLVDEDEIERATSLQFIFKNKIKPLYEQFFQRLNFKFYDSNMLNSFFSDPSENNMVLELDQEFNEKKNLDR